MSQSKTAKTILIIDDDSVITMQLQAILEQNNFIPTSASNGREGVEMALSDAPDLILLDRRMPEMDGNETLIHLKSNEQTQNIPVVMLTGDTRIADVSSSFELGALDYIVKPFDKDRLILRIQKNLQHSV